MYTRTNWINICSFKNVMMPFNFAEMGKKSICVIKKRDAFHRVMYGYNAWSGSCVCIGAAAMWDFRQYKGIVGKQRRLSTRSSHLPNVWFVMPTEFVWLLNNACTRVSKKCRRRFISSDAKSISHRQWYVNFGWPVLSSDSFNRWIFFASQMWESV